MNNFDLEIIFNLEQIRCISDALDIKYRKLTEKEEDNFKIYNAERRKLIRKIENIRWVKPFLYDVLFQYVSRLVKRVGDEETREELIRELLSRGDLNFFHRLTSMNDRERNYYLIAVWL